MRKSDGKIGSREVFVLITFMISLELSDMTPTLLFEEGKTATWMIPIIAGLVILAPFLMLSALLKKYGDQGLIDVIYHTTGKYVGFIISMALFAFMLLTTVTNSRDYVDIIQTLFLPETPYLAIYIVLMAAVYFIANRGLEVIGRTAWIVFPALTAILLLLIYMVVREVDMTFLYPFWGPGIAKLVKTSVQNSSIVADILLFTAFFPYIRTHKDFHLPALLGLLLSIAEMAGFYAIYIVMNDYPSIVHITFPFHQITMLVHAGRYFINVEAFFFAFWVSASVIRYTIYLYLTAFIFAQALRLKEHEPLLLPLTALVVMLGLIPENITESAWIYRQNILLRNTWIVFILLPFLLWMISKIRGDKAKCKRDV